jgi:hypothetical protein
MSFTKSKYDSCFLTQENQSSKSIFAYVVDDSMFINKNECNNFTPPFLTYIPSGVSPRSIDIENDLKGITRPYTKCVDCKYAPAPNSLPQPNPVIKKECTVDYNILPQGYTSK